MGKTARWFRGLLGGKKAESRHPATVPDSAPAKEKKRWRFVRSYRDKDRTAPPVLVAGDERRTGSYREGSSSLYVEGVEQSKHAIAVAAATAAVADAAVAAAQAAAAVVKLTSSGRAVYVRKVDVRRDDWAAVKIQAAFRGYLARRALRALKGLVKLQALVRGHIVRKQAAETLRCMHALVRVQSRARAGRTQSSEINSNSNKSSLSHPGPATPEKHESSICARSSTHQSSATLKRNPSKPNSTDTVDLHKMHVGWNWLDRWMDERSWDHQQDEKNDKILEIDTGKPLLNTTRRINNLQFPQSTLLSDKNGRSFATLPDSPSKDSTTAQLSIPSPSSVQIQSLSPLRFPIDVEDPPFCTANNSPQFFSASSMSMSTKKGPFTPSKSDSRSLFSAYSGHPNYMANTESYKAKVRSQSAPKQRVEFEKSRSTKRIASVHGSATLHTNFTSKAYPGSGRLDRLGMPIRG